MKPTIEIYYAEVCGLCHEAMDFFRSRNLPFTSHEVFWDEANDQFEKTATRQAMFKRIGGETDFVPQIFINDTHVAGWRKLQEHIKSGEFEQMLKG